MLIVSLKVIKVEDKENVKDTSVFINLLRSLLFINLTY